MRYRKNIIGPQVRKLRKQRAWSLDQLAAELAWQGIFISSQTLDRVETQQEFVGSIEVWAFATVFRTSVDHLYPPDSSAADVLARLRLLRRQDGTFPRIHPNGGAYTGTLTTK